MILVLATAGLFAAVPNPGTVTATLRANIGEYLVHGFNVNGTKYQPTATIDDAFGATSPSFKYGYKTNAGGTFDFYMNVGNFINQTIAGTVKIASVTSSKGAIVYNSTTGYKIFTNTGAALSAERNDEATITVNPAKATGFDHTGASITNAEQVGSGTTATAGAYEAEIIFSIVVS